jgi:diadenosine tetraphosphatase ApaH/serine/threonine PP2A family protein phosphatase
MAAATRAALGQERTEWLRALPRSHVLAPVALVHASPKSTWHSPALEASDAELESVYGSLGHPIVIYGHIHRAFIRRVSGMTIANTGSVSLSFDGDPRAAYLLLEAATPVIRRVAYDVDRELKTLAGSGFPHVDWIAKILRLATPQLP